MADRQAGALVQLRKLLESQAAKDQSDGQLLARFAAQKDEAAFAALMQRHAPLVYGVCRHVLGHEQDAEDAFQGTFLVLARKAGTIRRHSSVAGWLHGVAYRLSLKARQTAARRRQRESLSARTDMEPPSTEEAWRELQAILDEELQRLPEKYRTPFILCALQGKTKTEVARELLWKEGTVSSRLAQARKRLQTRLARRGVELSAVLCALAVTAKGAEAGVPALLSAHTAQAAASFGAGQAVATGAASAQAVALANGLLRSIAWSRFKEGLAVLLVVLLVSASTAFYLWRGDEGDPPDPAPAPKMRVEVPAQQAGEAKDTGRGQMVVHGQVSGPDGQPVTGADVAVISAENRPPGDRDLQRISRQRLLGVGKADAEGRFRLTVRRASPERDQNIYCLARGGGQAVAWESLQTLLELESVKLKLEPGQEVRGRLVDAGGSAAAGVKLRVGELRPASGLPASLEEDLPLEVWPPVAVTDAEGRFVLTGLTPLCIISVEAVGEPFGRQWLSLQTGKGGATEAGTLKLSPPRLLEGTVVAADTGEPVGNARVHISSRGKSQGFTRQEVTAHTNAAGRFSVKPYPGESLGITTCGPPGTAFLASYGSHKWPADSKHEIIQVNLRRGILLKGRVVEEGTTQPVVGARIQYRPLSGKSEYTAGGTELVLWPWLDASSAADGQFELPVLPGPGHLLIRGPDFDYIPIEVSERELIYGEKGGGRAHFPDALVALDLDPKSEPVPIVASLRRGVTVRGRAVRADGKPVATGFLVTRSFRGPGWEKHSEFLPIKGGRFEIPGWDPTKSEPVWFWDHKALEGAVAEIDAKEKQPTVRLAPFGSAAVRFVDAKGEVLRKLRIYPKLVVRDGADHGESWKKGVPLRLTLHADFQGWRQDPATGVVTLHALIPEATYIVEIGADRVGPPFSVTAGQKRELDDIVVDAGQR